jgi:taurine transport system permease protein
VLRTVEAITRVAVLMALQESEKQPEPITAEALARPQSFYSRNEASILPWIALVVLIVGWEVYGRLGNLSPLFFSYPSEIAEGWLELARSTLLHDLRISGIEFALGLGIALIAVPVGMVIGSIRRLRLAVDPLVNALYSTPILALTPLLVIIFGLGIASKVAIVAIMAFFPLLISTIEGVGTVDPSLQRAARSFGANQLDMYRDVVFPAIIPFLISGLRIAIGRAIIGVVIGEFIGATAGIGYRIRALASVFKTPEYLAGIVTLMTIAVVLNVLLKVLEKRVAAWRATGHRR